MIDDKDAVQDIIQEVFTSYYETSELKKQMISKPYSWLVRVSLNKSLDYLKRNKKHLSLDALSESDSDEDSFDRKTQYQALQKAIRELSPLEIKLVVLYSKDFSYKEIAEIADIKYTSVGKTLSRTLQKLKQILKRMNYELH